MKKTKKFQSLPDGEEFTAMMKFKDTIIVASNKRVFVVNGDVLEPMDLKEVEEQ